IVLRYALQDTRSLLGPRQGFLRFLGPFEIEAELPADDRELEGIVGRRLGSAGEPFPKGRCITVSLSRSLPVALAGTHSRRLAPVGTHRRVKLDLLGSRAFQPLQIGHGPGPGADHVAFSGRLGVLDTQVQQGADYLRTVKH